MSRVKANFIANLTGSGWSALMGLVCTPLYIRFMGMEAYGLVGFYLLLQGVIKMLDLGLSATMNRELARYSVMPEKAGEARNFVRTLEAGYWAVGLGIGVAVYLGAPFIATHWIRMGGIPAAEVQHAVRIMGVLVAFQWPLSLYHGGLMGLQRQVLLNGISVSMATLASVGALFVLWLVAPTITVYFTWQVCVAIPQGALTAFALWRCLPGSGNPARIEPVLLRNAWRFTAGMSGITLTAIVLMQVDKVILSRMLPLETFGYYILACVVGNSLAMLLITPLFNAIFPRFSSLVAAGDEISLSQIYHGSTQVMAVLALPAAAVIALFSREIMLIWTGNPEIASHTSTIVSLLVAGTAINGMMNPPFALQLSYGWTRIGLTINTFFILTMVPAILFAIGRYGPAGAAFVWLALNGIYMAFGVPITHRRLLKGEAGRWFAQDLFPPLLAAVFVAGLGRMLISAPSGTFVLGAEIAIVYLVATGAAILATKDIRTALRGIFPNPLRP